MVDFLGSTTVIPGSPASSSVYSRVDGTAVVRYGCPLHASARVRYQPTHCWSRNCIRSVRAGTRERFTCLGSIELHSLGFLFRMA